MEKYLQGSIGDALIISKEGMFSDLLWRQVTVPAVWLPGDLKKQERLDTLAVLSAVALQPQSDSQPQWTVARSEITIPR